MEVAGEGEGVEGAEGIDEGQCAGAECGDLFAESREAALAEGIELVAAEAPEEGDAAFADGEEAEELAGAAGDLVESVAGKVEGAAAPEGAVGVFALAAGFGVEPGAEGGARAIGADDEVEGAEGAAGKVAEVDVGRGFGDGGDFGGEGEVGAGGDGGIV